MFPNIHGGRLSPDSVKSPLAKYVRVDSERCLSLVSTQASPHVLKHSASMELYKLASIVR